MPCEAIAGQPRYFFGGPFQHALTPLLADKFVNTTAVNNWDPSEGAPATIPPYERWTQDFSGGLSCEVHHCIDDGAPCIPWLRPLPNNTWSNSGEQVDMAVAKKGGFKNVQARRAWNGRFGYLDIEWSNSADTWTPCSDPSSATAHRSYISAPLRTRYNTLDISTTWHWEHHEYTVTPITLEVTDDVTTKDQSAEVTQTINSAGILNTTALSLSPNTSQEEPLVEYPQQAFAALQIGFKHYGHVVNDMVKSIADLSSYTSGTTTVWTANSITVTNNADDETIELVTWGGDSFNRTIYQNYPDISSYLPILIESYSLSDTVLAYQKETYARVGEPGGPVVQGSPVDYIKLNVTGTLSSPITDSTIYADIKTLLDEWDLTDDAQYPWRTDLKTGVAPLVARDELLTQEFDPNNFYIRDYGAPVTDPLGNNFGDPDWGGDTGYTKNPNSLTGTARAAYDFAGHRSGATVDIQVSGFSHTDATPTFSIIGGSFPPGVSMDGSGHITGIIGDDGHYGVTIEITCGVAAATGAIIGAPKPAGYQNVFDFLFTDVRGCCYEPLDNPGFKQWVWYQVGWGQDVVSFNSNTGCHLPLNSTHWNNWWDAVNKPPGAWVFYADTRQDYFPIGCASTESGSGAGDASYLVAQKWAEVIEKWPSQNFAKPAGDMKFWYDEFRVYCATNVSGSGAGSTWSLIDPNTLLAPVTLESVDIWGGPGVGGFYASAAYSAGVVTLGAKLWDVPSNWASKSNGDESQSFGPLRWSDYPSLLGRVAVTSDEAGTAFTFATAQPAFGMNSSTHQEQIDIYDASMTALSINVTATRISDTQFSTTATFPSAAFVMIHGTAPWYVNDATSKGDYSVLEWLADFRSFGEYTRLGSITDCDGAPVTGLPVTNAGGGPLSTETQFATFNQTPGCLPFVPCAPKVVCVSPNGESFTNGVTYDFPASFVCDAQYGSKWWGYVQQAMTDLFWQPPHRPCNIEPCARWLADDGTCQENTPLNPPAYACPGDEEYVDGETQPPVYRYSFPPMVEARLTVPNNYGTEQDEAGPVLPLHIQIGWLSPVDHVSADGDVAYPPEPPGVSKDGGIPGGSTTAWDIHSRLCASSSGGCRFDYAATGC